MRLPPNGDSVRDYLEWSYRRADMLMAAWELRQKASACNNKKKAHGWRQAARTNYLLSLNFKKELNNIRDELKGQP